MMIRQITLGLSLGLALFLTAPAFAVDNMDSNTPVDLTSVRAKIAAQDYAGALTELRDLAEVDQQADIYNLLGFTLRKTGDFKTALTYYNKALELEPDNKGAHEYLGELYVETGQLAKAKGELAALAKICPLGCEELDDLEIAIARTPSAS